MILNQPYCHGESGRPHVLTPMRVEVAHEGALPMLRCPECWRQTAYAETGRLDDLAARNEQAVIVSRELVDRNGGRWSGPFEARFVQTDDPLIVEIEVRRLA